MCKLDKICGCGGTGRRKRLKISRQKCHTGSNPVTRTNKEIFTKYNFNREEYDPKLVEELQSYSDVQGTIRLSECSPEFLADYVWESTPEEDLQEAITANKQVGEPIPECLREAYEYYLSGMTIGEAIASCKKEQKGNE